MSIEVVDSVLLVYPEGDILIGVPKMDDIPEPGRGVIVFSLNTDGLTPEEAAKLPESNVTVGECGRPFLILAMNRAMAEAMISASNMVLEHIAKTENQDSDQAGT